MENNLPGNSIIFQAAKLGDVPYILSEFEWAEKLLQQEVPVGRIYGVSGGALTALAFALTKAAIDEPVRWGAAKSALQDFSTFLRDARSSRIRSFNWNPKYGPFNLKPLRRWVAARLRAYSGRDDLKVSDLPLPLYLCAIDKDAILTLFGPENESLQFQYQFVHVGPPQDAPLLDGLIAALSTVLSTEPVMINGEWYRDCRPPIPDAGAIITDLEVDDARPVLRRLPYTMYRKWKLNFITTSFIMHSMHECNQPILTSYYLDLLERHRSLLREMQSLPLADVPQSPVLAHIDLPYVGSTEASTNMRESVEKRIELTQKFEKLLEGQLDHIPFDQPANVIYGAGGFSGILAGLVATREINKGFERGGGQIQQIYGISAGVFNSFFHAVQLAANRYPDLYKPAALSALVDLENFIRTIEAKKVVNFNRNPFNLWQGWANLKPLEAFLLERLAAYTGSKHPEQITFDDIGLPFTVTVERNKIGFTAFFGTSLLGRRMIMGSHKVEVRSIPVVQAMIAGWSMNTYIQPALIDGETYQDGGGSLYDIGLLVACLDRKLTNLINIHLDDPEGHSYRLPPRPDLVRILLDTHNYTFPEERRRMFLTCNLLYQHYQLRAEYEVRMNALSPGIPLKNLPPDFRQDWVPSELSNNT